MTAPFVLFRDDWSGGSTLFDAPERLIVARDAAGFDAAFAAAEQARQTGKWLAGYISYEAGYLLEHKLAQLLPGGRNTPLICLGVFDGPSETPHASLAGAPSHVEPIFDARAAWSLEDYAERFERLHRHLALGDCYQANLTFPVEAKWRGDPLDSFDALTARQPVRYGALVSLGEPIILSRSPELFFEVDDSRWIEAHPMKGTAPRGVTTQEDERLRTELRADPKNQAENRMIVDLLRNDISLISEVGTLDVPELFRVETYPTLHTLVSRVRAKLRPGADLARNLRRAVSVRFDHGRAKNPRDGNFTGARGPAARCLLRSHRLDRALGPHAVFPWRSGRSRSLLTDERSSMSAAAWCSIPLRRESIRNAC